MIKPYREKPEDKKQQVKHMFDNIAGKYDFFNHFFSFGIDKFWRTKAIALLKDYQNGVILDIATGTADMAIQACKKFKNIKITGVDISENMLKIGMEKVKREGLSDRIILMNEDSESLPFNEFFFDAAMVAFGVRNFGDIESGLTEIHRVLKPGALFIVLEFSKPHVIVFGKLYTFYFKNILPFVAGIFSKDGKAYKYLPASVMAFPEKQDFISLLQKTGFSECSFNSLTFGVATIYKGRKE